ncbi:hypothetical protein BT69DRAFT_1348849 [Atractiella rhizophila]|nr:hypothetical protein BT69DRAFT_1348849 [Atractiella rhizophila]
MSILPQALAHPLEPPFAAGYDRISAHPNLLRSTLRLAVAKSAISDDFESGKEIQHLRGYVEWAILNMLSHLKEAQAARKVVNSTIPSFSNPVPDNNMFCGAFLLACAAVGLSGTLEDLIQYTCTATHHMVELKLAWKDPSFERTLAPAPTSSRSPPSSQNRRRQKLTFLNPDDVPPRFVALHRIPQRLELMTKVDVEHMNRKAFEKLVAKWSSPRRFRPSISAYLDVSISARHEPHPPRRDHNPYTLVQTASRKFTSDDDPAFKPKESWFAMMKEYQDQLLRDYLLAIPVCKMALAQLTTENDGFEFRKWATTYSKSRLVAYCVLSASLRHGPGADRELMISYIRASVAAMFSYRFTLNFHDYYEWKELYPDTGDLEYSALETLREVVEENEEN